MILGRPWPHFDGTVTLETPETTCCRCSTHSLVWPSLESQCFAQIIALPEGKLSQGRN